MLNKINYLITENIEPIIKDFHIDYYSGQHNWQLVMYIPGEEKENKLVGYLDYSEFKDQIYIDMIKIEEEFQGLGYGKDLVRFLINKYSGKKINWGLMTSDGFQLKKSLEKEGYKFNA